MVESKNLSVLDLFKDLSGLDILDLSAGTSCGGLSHPRGNQIQALARPSLT